jgi:hypothetical protein
VVDVVVAVPVALLLLERRVELVAGAAADAVDQDVDPVPGIEGLLDGAVGRGLVGHVAGDHEGLAAGLLDGLAGLLEALGRPADDGDLRADAGQRAAGADADAPGAARHDGDAVGEGEALQFIHGACSPEVSGRGRAWR